MSVKIDLQHYAKFFRLAQQGCVIATPAGFFLSVNPAFEEILGFSFNELTSRPMLDFVHPEDRQRTQAEAERIARGGDLADFDNRYIRKDGSTVWLRWRARWDEQDGIVYAVARDISAEKELEAQHRRLTDLFMKFPSMSAVLKGPNLVFEMLNPAFANFLGGRDVIGIPFKDVFSDMDGEFFHILKSVFQEGKRFVGIHHKIKMDPLGDGKIKEGYYNLICEPIKGLDEAISAIGILAIDMTDVLAMKTKLQMSEHMASVGTLAAGIAHEVNTPLTYTMTSLGLIRQELDGLGLGQAHGPIETLLQKAERGLYRARDIVRALNMFSRQEPLRLGLLKVEDIVRSSVDLVENEIRHAAFLDLKFEPAPQVIGNEGRLTQVLVNLLMNACQAIGPGRADQNTISVRTGTTSIGEAMVEIEDTGCGIDPQNLSKIFDPFFTTKMAEGTGLGLSICHGIVEALKGRIEVESRLGRGSRFRVILPVAQAQRSLEETHVPVEENRRLRVLVIEDDLELGEVLERALKVKHDVIFTRSTEEALDRLKREGHAFDRVVCDVMMPQMSGMSLYQMVQNQWPGLERKFILMTGGAFNSKIKDWLTEIPNPKLEKPFAFETLNRILMTPVSK